MVFGIGSAVLVALAIYCRLGVRRAYDRGQILPLRVSGAIWMLDTAHLILVVLASRYHVWELHYDMSVALIAGGILIGVGLAALLTGMVTFQSLRRISGMDSTNLVSTGIYRWSRNPQYVGWFACLLGISLMGRSGFAFLLTVIFMIGIHLYTIQQEEPYLARLFGDEYRIYESRTSRYFGVPKKPEWP